MAVLIVAAAVCGGGYLVSLKIWPETTCRRCGGSGKNAGSTTRRFGRCKRCGGSGRRPRPGARLLTHR
jgi:DnaJ-class molecular chaperone